MELRNEKLSLFFEQIKTVTFWQRIFSWNTLRGLSYEAYEEFKRLVASLSKVSTDLDHAARTTDDMRKDFDHLKSRHTELEAEFRQLDTRARENEARLSEMNSIVATKDETIRLSEKRIVEHETELALLSAKTERFSVEITELRKQNAVFMQTENERKTKYEKDVSTLNAIRMQVQDDRNRELAERQRNEIQRLESLKETWAKHQDNVVGTIKRICQKHTIEYVENVPFKGKPDTVIKICDEYVVFDAKSPASDNLENFPTYIRTQTESVGKYVKEENVRKDLFLVVPSNTVDVLDQFCYNMADYSVYIVTVDALEPIILSLKKIEDYEFVNQMSPEERENICRVIGKFAHMTKRRIQIDHFFAWEFLDILTKCEADLPREILEKVVEFEKSEKLNPPQERRSKQILTRDLEDDAGRIQKEAEAKAIVFPPSLHRDIGQLPLYDDDESGHR